MKKLFLTVLSVCFLCHIQAQETLTLENCIRMGIENNLMLKSGRNELDKNRYAISENRANLLPKLNAYARLNDNFDPPVSVTDGRSFGNHYNVTNTLRLNSSVGLQLTLPLYNQTIYTSMGIVKLVDQLGRLSYEKAKRDLALNITKMYYIGQVTMEQIGLVKGNITRLEELKAITKALYENDMTLEIDVQRIDINLQNLKVQYDNALAMLEQQLNTLKYIIDYPAEKEICLVPANTDEIEKMELSGLDYSLYEFEILNKKITMAEKQKQLISSGYLPSLTLTGNFGFSAFTDKYKNWFHSGPSNHWYRSAGLGLTLSIPVFDGLDKHNKIQKAKIDIANSKLMQENTRKDLETEYVNATKDLMTQQRNLGTNKKNYQLAEDVYNVTSDRYKEGIANMTEVLQDEMRMTEAQNHYLNAFLNYRLSSLTIMKLTGATDRMISTFK